MKIYIDSAAPDTVAEALGAGVARGVTTNPTLCKRAGIGWEDFRRYFDLWRGAGAECVCFQTWGQTQEELYRRGAAIAAFGDGVIVKVPATPAGFGAARKLIDAGSDVLMTAVYTTEQAIVAGGIGAWGIAPYLGRMNDAGIDGLSRIGQMARALESDSTGVLAASVREPSQVVELRLRGVTWFTLNETVLHALTASTASDADAARFEVDAQPGRT